jgi:hypothetical protein
MHDVLKLSLVRPSGLNKTLQIRAYPPTAHTHVDTGVIPDSKRGHARKETVIKQLPPAADAEYQTTRRVSTRPAAGTGK